MPKPLFKVPHRRPTYLSDPYHDFTPAMLHQILQTPDSLLKWHDYQSLLGPILPAGTYEEVVYFLPRAFDFLLADHENAYDIIFSIVGFASKNAVALRTDKILDLTRHALEKCLLHWTSTFTVQHFDHEPCKANGNVRVQYDIVQHSHFLSEMLGSLFHFETHQDIAHTFIHQLVHHNSNPIKAAWFLELAISQPGPAIYKIKDKSIQSLFTNPDLLKSAGDIVLLHLFENEPSPTYWNNTFQSLAL